MAKQTKRKNMKKFSKKIKYDHNDKINSKLIDWNSMEKLLNNHKIAGTQRYFSFKAEIIQWKQKP